ncbi:MAG: DNA recombination protein RmuC [Thermoanaerobaculia bacterium]
MDPGLVALLALGGLAIGLLVGFLVGQRRLTKEEHRRVAAETRCEELQRRMDDSVRVVNQLEGTFAKLSRDALDQSVQQLLQVVKPHLDGNKGEIASALDTKKVEIEGLLAPLRQMLETYQEHLHKVERERVATFSGLNEQLRALHAASQSAQQEASRLATALRAPQVRGSWGENTLRKCVEMAGMSAFCDFEWQYSLEGDDNRRVRPDMVVRLPEDRVIAVDAKTPLDAYLAAAEEPDEKRRKELLAQHAATVKRHIDSLSRKEYQEYVQRSLGKSLSFTILFISGEPFLSAAMITDPSIFEYAAAKNVVLASPTIFVPLLRALASGWKAEQLEEDAQKATMLAQELYQRFLKVFEHFEGIGKALNSAVSRYNDAVRSVETRLAPKARQLEEHIASHKTLEEIARIDKFALAGGTVPEPEGEEEI